MQARPAPPPSLILPLPQVPPTRPAAHPCILSALTAQPGLAHAPAPRGCTSAPVRFPALTSGVRQLPCLPACSTLPVAQLSHSVPAPSWSLPHLPTPTGRSTAGKRAPGPPDQTAPAVLLKVRGTQRWAVGPGCKHPKKHSSFQGRRREHFICMISDISSSAL